MAEFELIERIRRRAGQRGDVVLGIGDDAALLRPPPGQLLVASADLLNVGVHFPADAQPFDVGWKALAVNLSDLAAMAAEPAWALLTLALPCADADWIDAFMDGFATLASEHGVALVGGDTTRGPLSIGVSVHGFVPETGALRRSAARAGDDIWVTGTLGDAAAGLAEHGRPRPAASSAAADFDTLAARLHRPTPRLAAGQALRGLAHACIDVSDGLFADLGHVLAASRVGARIALADLPCSAALAGIAGGEARWQLQAAGGDDYELCFSAPAEHRQAIRAAMAQVATPVTCIGTILADGALLALDPQGQAWLPRVSGYQHFDRETR